MPPWTLSQSKNRDEQGKGQATKGLPLDLLWQLSRNAVQHLINYKQTYQKVILK